MIEYSAILSAIRGMLGYDSSASVDAVVHTVASDLARRHSAFEGILRARVRNAVEDMLRDGGLRLNNRSWIYMPRGER